MSDSEDFDNECANYASELHRKLTEFLEEGKYSDVTIQVQDRLFKCHRVVLASASKYFDSMFGGSFKEGRAENLILHEMDPTSFDTILKSLYQRSPPAVNVANVHALLRTSNFLGLCQVERRCVNFILNNISSIDVLEYFSLARAVGNAGLVDVLGEHIIRHLMSTIKKGTFVDLQYDDLNNLLDRYRLSSPFPFENFLLDALIQWMCHSIAERKKLFEKLIEKVDFEKISVEYIEFFMEKYKIDRQVFKELGNDQVLRQGMCLKKTVMNSIMLNNEFADDGDALPILYEESQFLKQAVTLHVCTRYPYKWKTEFTIYSMDNTKVKPEWFCSCNFTKKNSSQFVHPLHAYVALDEPSYLFCQEDTWGKGLLFNAYSSIDLSSEPLVLRSFPFGGDIVWRNIVPRMSGANGRIYLYESGGNATWSDKFGGLLPEFSREEYERHVYHYNCGINKWFPVPERKTKLNESYLISNDKLVYMIGGQEYSSNVNRANYVQAYDHRAPHWLELPRSHCNETEVYTEPFISFAHSTNEKPQYSGCFLNEKLYLYYRNLLQVFDPVANRWEKIKEYDALPRNTDALVFRIASYNNSLWMFQNFPENTVEVYDAISQEWRELGPSPSLFNLKTDHYSKLSFNIMDVLVYKPLAF